jgi:hypothetical protein
MSIDITEPAADRMVVVYAPNPDSGDDLYLWAALNQWLWSQLKIAMDCSYVEIHLVYGREPGGEHGAEGAGAEPTGGSGL